MGWKLWFCAPESRRQSRFLEESGTQLQELGFRAEFVDDGWDAFYDSSQAVLQTTRNSALLLGLLLVLGFLACCVPVSESQTAGSGHSQELGYAQGFRPGPGAAPYGPFGFCWCHGWFCGGLLLWLRKGPRGCGIAPDGPVLGGACSADQIDWIRGCSVVFPASFRGDLLTIPSFCSILPLLQGGKTHGKKKQSVIVRYRFGAGMLPGKSTGPRVGACWLCWLLQCCCLAYAICKRASYPTSRKWSGSTAP